MKNTISTHEVESTMKILCKEKVSNLILSYFSFFLQRKNPMISSRQKSKPVSIVIYIQAYETDNMKIKQE